MALTLHTIRRIGKAQLKNCTFTKSEGYTSDCEMREQNRKLHLSMLVRRSTKNPVKIVFNTTEGYSAVYTEIWGATEQFVLLKDGSEIPLEAIVGVSLE